MVTLHKIIEIYKQILYAKILVIHDEFANDMLYDLVLGNLFHANDDYEANKNFEQEGLNDN